MGNGRDAKRDESPRNYSPYPGGMLDLIKAVPVAVDKHSTGGVGDKTLITAQGRNVRYIDEPGLLPTALIIETTPAPRSGVLAGIHAHIIGETAVSPLPLFYEVLE